MASASPHYSSSASNYEVFLSFHGKDVRTGFADHLYHALVGAEIRTFRDDEELKKGEEIAPNLLAAIRQSRISIPILSMNYASSKWCLNELKEISECQKTRNQTVLPVFYKIEPTNVRNQTGEYEKAFGEHSKHFDQETVEKWQDALKEIGKLDGWHLKEDMHEGKMVKEIMKLVSSTLNKSLVHFPSNLVGMESHTENMLELLDIKSKVTKIVGIHGFGGIGKTTIARVVCNTILNEFDEYAYAFIENVRQDAGKHGIPYLQNKLLKGILKDGIPHIIDMGTGIEVIKQRLSGKKVLVVLDDVNEDIQVESLIGDGSWFGIGSKIIITGRDKDISISLKSTIYEPSLMNSNHSLELFSRHAFKMDQPQEDYLDLSQEVVEVLGGLPLALEVIGSLLSKKKKKSIWVSMLKMLQTFPNNEVMERLKISYDDLKDTEQQMFLDTACFFIGMKKDLVCCIWEGCGFFPEIRLDILCARCLITINEDDELGMHDVLRDLGRDIVRQESKILGERSRIWYEDEVLDVLVKKKGTNKCVGLTIDLKEKAKSRCLMGEGLDAMTELRLLQLDHAQLEGNCNNSFSELRWLCWKGCLEPYVLTNLCPEKLVVLDLSYSEFTENWTGWNHIKMASNLKFLNLAYCHQIGSTPDLSGNRVLEVLILRGCDKLTRIDTSIGFLKELVELDLGGCKSLEDLPLEIYELGASLKTLKLSECTSLKTLSEHISGLTNLRDLEIKFLSIESIPNLSNLKQLRKLKIQSHKNLSKIGGLHGLEALQELVIQRCKNIAEIHLVDGSKEALRSLDRLPPNISNLKKLRNLRITFCNNLSKILGLDTLESLQVLIIRGCYNLAEIQCLDRLKSLKDLRIVNCKSLEKLPDLSNLKELSSIFILACGKLSEIPGLDGLESLKALSIFTCDNLTKIHGVERLKSLKTLRIEVCCSLESLDLSNFNNLEKLRIKGCKNMPDHERPEGWRSFRKEG